MGTAEPLDIRAYSPTDFDAVVGLWKAAGVWRPWNDPARDIDFATRDAHSTLLIGRHGDAVVATAMCGEDGHRGWVYYLAVLPQHQGEGHGRQMMAACEDWLRARGIWKIQLLIRADNADASAFYERLGYADTRTRCFQKVLEAPSPNNPTKKT
jgi:ribosomal protein S18 acetylase RimI-like enzyme